MVALPTGTVTFLFTDLEGSTRLWERHPAAMRPAVARHDALLRAAVGTNRGLVVKATGDGLHAVFARAEDAAAAARDGQRALTAEAWGVPGPVRVRMGLHTGTAEERDGDYYGPAVNRAARVMGVGHGGQVLLSDVTADLLRGTLPAEVALRDLGAHRLPDVAEPERLFQLVVAGLPSDFPPLRSPDARRHNLPLQLTSFVGRGAEMAAIKDLLGRSRLVTLTGTGGCGKTRLALQAAAGVLAEHPDGVWLVELAPLADEELIPGAVLAALGVHAATSRPPLEQLVDFLRPRTALLVLDNCEHLIGAAARTAEALMRGCPGVRVLATSREMLGVASELPWRVPSLAVPGPRARPPIAELVRYEAVQLFVERARVVAPGFAPTERNADALAQVCARLDGIPLALELAAARVRVLTVEQIAARLDDRFRLLTGGGRTALRRQQTLRAAVDWSHDLLSEPERALLRRLSVFAGGWTLEAAEAVCTGGPIDPPEVLDLLTGLVDKSLVAVERQGAEVRYRLSETLRQYAEERLLEAGEAAAIRTRHRDWCLALAEGAADRLYGPEERMWLERLEREHDNMRAALGWCLGVGEAGTGLRLAGGLTQFWGAHAHVREGWAWVQQLLARAREVPDDPARRAALARGLAWAGYLGRWAGDHAAAMALTEEAIALARPLADALALPSALNNLSALLLMQGRHAEAGAAIAEAIPLGRRLGDPVTMAFAPHGAGCVAFHAGDLAAARAFFEETLVERRDAGDLSGTGRELAWLGHVALAERDAERAHGLYAEAVSVFRKAGDQAGLKDSLHGLAWVALERGDAVEAERRLREYAAIEREIGANPWVLPVMLAGSAGVAALRVRAEGAPAAERALRLAGAAARAAGEEPNLWHRWVSAIAQRWLAPAFAALGGRGAPAAETAWAAGQALTPEQAIAEALAGAEGRETTDAPIDPPGPPERPTAS